MVISKMSRLLSLLLSCFCLAAMGQVQVTGYVLNDLKKGIPEATVSTNGYGTVTDGNGFFNLSLPEGKYTLQIRHISFKADSLQIEVKNQALKLSIELELATDLLEDVELVDERDRFSGTAQIDPNEVEMLPSTNESVEALLKTYPGVSSSNELSTQYSVRGGNFDENLVYVNGIEINRPFLIRAGQQEGLSFINPDMVSSIRFSAGGFEARYGDKMSSVLDVSYLQPKKDFRTLRLSLLGGSATIGGISKNKRVSYLMGFRHQRNANLLSSLDTDAEYNTTFNDFQSLFTFYLRDDWDINVMLNYASNQYHVVPQNRQTDFGTVTSALRLSIFFDGQEVDEYQTFMSAISSNFRPNKNLTLSWIASAYANNEQEYFDVQGQYRLGDLETNLGSESFGEVVFNRGIGTHINHARNRLNSRFYVFQHKGLYTPSWDKSLRYGIKYQIDEIVDHLWEWRMVDSAFYSTPTSSADQPFELHELIRGDANLHSSRTMAYVDFTEDFNWKGKSFYYNIGLRAHHWSLNGQTTISPRASLAYKPNWEADVVFRLASGFYHQMPIYRELRAFDGSLNKEIQAQQSIHAVVGMDYQFEAWDRPFKFVGEAYYKDLSSLIPYQIDNVRIRYYANNNASGYATGLDLKVNGEFVKGIQSWASLSVMTIQEDIEGDFYYDTDSNYVEAGYIPRPADQRVNFSIYFQDYLPNNPTVRVNLNLVFGTGLPFGAPQSERREQTFRLPPYRRVDIGFSKVLKEENQDVERFKILNRFSQAWFSVEVFNLLQIRNTVSYLWVEDTQGLQYAVPNFLTSRLLNAKLVLKF